MVVRCIGMVIPETTRFHQTARFPGRCCSVQAGDMAAMEFQLQQANLGVPGLPVATANLANPVAAAPAAVAAAAPGALPLPPPIAPAAAQPVPAQPRVRRHT